MTTLFRRINPAQKFRITKHQIAKLLRIPSSLIVKIESWLYVVFVHRLDKGGQLDLLQNYFMVRLRVLTS